MRFIRQLSLFLVPFVLFLFAELFLLPIDFFCFRTLEAIEVYQFQKFLPGPFYPNMEVERTEVGDLALHTPYSRPRHVRWQTDALGMRNSPDVNPDNADVVIVGDSFAYGSGLSQEQMLAAVLGRLTGLRVYTYAHPGLNRFLSDRRFSHSPYKTVIFAGREGTVYRIPRLEAENDQAPHPSPLMQNVLVLADRVSKMIAVRALQATVDRRFNQGWNRWIHGDTVGLGDGLQLSTDHEMIFRQSDVAPGWEPKPKFFITHFQDYTRAFSQRQVRFAVLIIPIDTTIYYKRIPLASSPNHPEKLVKLLRENGVQAIDIVHDFELAADHVMLYQQDDNHWSPAAVEIAARALQKQLFPN